MCSQQAAQTHTPGPGPELFKFSINKHFFQIYTAMFLHFLAPNEQNYMNMLNKMQNRREKIGIMIFFLKHFTKSLFDCLKMCRTKRKLICINKHISAPWSIYKRAHADLDLIYLLFIHRWLLKCCYIPHRWIVELLIMQNNA